MYNERYIKKDENIMILLNTFNQQQQHTNFNAQIKSNLYFKKSVGQITENGTFSDKNLLVKFWNLIKNDSKMNTFEMNRDIVSFSNKTVQYSFTIDGEKVLLSGKPFINPSAFRDLADNHFIKVLSEFIKDNYGEKTYNKAVKDASKYKPKYVADSLASINRQLKQ